MYKALLKSFKKNLKIYHNPYRIVVGSLFSTFFFAILYFLNDIYCRNNFEMAQKNGLINENQKSKESLPNIDFLHYLWFSLITQTTVGYSNMLSSDNSKNEVHIHVFKLNQYINMFQLLSIFGILAFL